MTRFVGHDAAPDTHPDQRQIAQYVEQFVARAFVREAQLEVVEVSFGNLDIGLVAELRKAFELFGRDVALDDHDRIVQVATFNQSGGEQRLYFTNKDESTAGSHFVFEIMHIFKGSKLIRDNSRIVRNQYIQTEILVR